MNEVVGNIWQFHEEGEYICIPTNAIVKEDGNAVMGKGLALQCNQKYSEISSIIGARITQFGNIPCLIKKYKIITFPTKQHWQEEASLKLIERSARLLRIIIKSKRLSKVYVPYVGCGEGGLNWNTVKVILEKSFQEDVNKIIIVKYGGSKT
jgi:hypothetical protein